MFQVSGTPKPFPISRKLKEFSGKLLDMLLEIIVDQVVWLICLTSWNGPLYPLDGLSIDYNIVYDSVGGPYYGPPTESWTIILPTPQILSLISTKKKQTRKYITSLFELTNKGKTSHNAAPSDSGIAYLAPSLKLIQLSSLRFCLRNTYSKTAHTKVIFAVGSKYRPFEINRRRRKRKMRRRRRREEKKEKKKK